MIPIPHWPCDCINWCREIEFKDGTPVPATFHHPRCAHVDESLIDVFKVSDGSSYFYTTDEFAAETEAENVDDVKIAKVKMHREIYERLPEFAGF